MKEPERNWYGPWWRYECCGEARCYRFTCDEARACHFREGTTMMMGQTESPSLSGERSHQEGPVARMIENETARLPSDTFLWAAGASVAASLFLQATGRRHASLFVGQWAPTLLILGLYNKLVKIAGSDGSTGL